MSYLHCPRCRLAIRCRADYLTMTHCPRCLAHAGIRTTLFASPLNAYELRARPDRPAATGRAAARDSPTGPSRRSRSPQPSSDPPPDMHRAAVARTLQWADGCAARGEYADGLEWLAVIEALGDTLPSEYESKRERWRAALAARQAP